MINNLLKGEQSELLHQNGTSTNMVNSALNRKSVQRVAEHFVPMKGVTGLWINLILWVSPAI
jgi:DNA-binding PucR family transcriptional regulator